MSATTLALIVVMLILLYGGISFWRDNMLVRGGALSVLSAATLIALLRLPG
jgi:hypothetical protein